jgi:hypothetical protein
LVCPDDLKHGAEGAHKRMSRQDCADSLMLLHDLFEEPHRAEGNDNDDLKDEAEE